VSRLAREDGPPRPADLPPIPAGRAPLVDRMSSVTLLSAMSLQAAVKDLPIPAYVLDRNRRFHWLNCAAVELLGERAGQSFCRIVAREHVTAAQTQFAQRILGGATEPRTLTLIDRDGLRTEASVVSAPLVEDGRSLGVFGLVFASAHRTSAAAGSTFLTAGKALTPRQFEILRLLALGHDTNEIAARLGVVHHTVRNHMRGLFRELGVHSRLHAVARAYQIGLLDAAAVLGEAKQDLQ
jgi:DNA-binding CsgD family transcriptional regulator